MRLLFGQLLEKLGLLFISTSGHTDGDEKTWSWVLISHLQNKKNWSRYRNEKLKQKIISASSLNLYLCPFLSLPALIYLYILFYVCIPFLIFLSMFCVFFYICLSLSMFVSRFLYSFLCFVSFSMYVSLSLCLYPDSYFPFYVLCLFLCMPLSLSFYVCHSPSLSVYL